MPTLPRMDDRRAPSPPDATRWPNRFAGLGPAFHTPMRGTGLPDPHWVATSDDAAAVLGWPADWWQRWPEALAVFSGNATWEGMAPLASVYSGHQFGVWAGQLGDGRALMLGEVDTPQGPMELQLKGAGRTPYSRMGDGRAVLRSSIREFLGSEAMHHLGIPTSRGLCLTGSALPVRRERVETAAVVTRVAPSFLRFGHFEHFYHHDRHEELRTLAEHAIAHHFPACREAEQPVLALLSEVTERTARLIAQWQAVGFCHGVMNTDNMSLLGLTIDYGPFGFLDVFDPQHICNHSDEGGLYAYARQPKVGWWNLHAFAQALVPLVGRGEGTPEDVAAIRAALARYEAVFGEALAAQMRAKLGLREAREGDQNLVNDWLRLLETQKADYTIAMRRLCDFSPRDAGPVRDVFMDREAFDVWATRYTERLAAEHSIDAERQAAMRRANPRVVLRNHLAETAIQRAEQGDFSEVQRLLAVLSRPFDDDSGTAADAGFPPDWAQQLSVSCSS